MYGEASERFPATLDPKSLSSPVVNVFLYYERHYDIHTIHDVETDSEHVGFTFVVIFSELLNVSSHMVSDVGVQWIKLHLFGTYWQFNHNALDQMELFSRAILILSF